MEIASCAWSLVAGTWASSVDGELLWRCCGRWTVRWMAVKGSRDRSSDRAAAVASTPGSRAQDGRRVSWFAPQNQGGGWQSKTPSRGGTGIGLGTDGGDGRRRRLGPRCGRGGDGRRAASRAVRRPRRERRLGPRRGGGNLPARGVLAVFSKAAIYPGFMDLPKPWTRFSSRWRHRGEDFISKKEPRPSDEIVYRGMLQTNRSDRSMESV
jgi:hypothetical protein